MVKLNILPLLDKKGKSKYWLYKQLGMSYQNFNHMVNNETQSIKLERIETLCLLLDCTPNDLFVIDYERHEEVRTMNVAYKKTMGENIYRLRRERTLSQEQLSTQLQARGCNITRSTLAKIEAGQRHVYPDEIKLLREVLGVSYEDIFA